MLCSSETAERCLRPRRSGITPPGPRERRGWDIRPHSRRVKDAARGYGIHIK